MAIASNLGFPRIGAQRELKKSLEAYWAGKSNEATLLATAREIRKQNWLLQQQAGIEHIPSNDFSFYDQVLDMACVVGAIPSRYGWKGNAIDLGTYFTMARGGTTSAMEMTKWFDTNYHYIVPEFEPGMTFRLASTKPVDEFLEAKALGVTTRPVVIGPVSFLLSGKSKDTRLDRLSLLDGVLPVYIELLKKLASAGATWVQMDEPFLTLDVDEKTRRAYHQAYAAIASAVPNTKILVATYFEGLRDNLSFAVKLPVTALHLDLVRDPQQLGHALEVLPATLSLSLGVIDGRNIWKTDFEQALGAVERATTKLGTNRILIAPSCSLLHSPVDLDNETRLESDVRQWLAFAKQKLSEVATLTRAATAGRTSVAKDLESNRMALTNRRTSTRIHNPQVKKRASGVTPDMLTRRSPYASRQTAQRRCLNLPAFPTTTIGSFPQTTEVRQARAEFKSGKRDAASYNTFLKAQTEQTVRFQETIDMDVLVHGEFERNDMVEYFGEQLDGFTFTQNGWVQSYGSRCVKPPVIFGDVSRPKPMTVEWSRYAQSLTDKPMKGMLTGPVTILQWSFVRDDQPRSETCKQIALALRDEVADLETAGIKVIQIDEPAIREGLPLRKADWNNYLSWAVDCFRLSSTGVRDETQIHTHMCYSEFNDIIDAIARLDADVISIETSRSQMELLDVFKRSKYPNEIGPGVYDIHSPRIPTEEEMVTLLRKALEVLKPEQVWVNPDCGLKTRRWEEVKPALISMVTAAKKLRAQYR